MGIKRSKVNLRRLAGRFKRLAKSGSSYLYRLLRKFDYRKPTHLALAGVIFLTAATPVLNKLLEVNHYELSKPTKALLTKSNPALTAKIKLDERGETFQFNQEEIANKKANPDQQSQAIGQGASEKTKVVYGFDAGKDIKKGVTITDANSLISFKLIPELNARDGELVDGHIVYPLKGMPAKLIYTPEGYGLKEDLVLDKEIGDTLEFRYRLELPASLEARLLPDGSVGVYSASPALFGNISFGSDADKAKVEKAREKADKDFLQFIIPAPIIKQSGSEETVGQSEFVLDGSFLTVKARKLKGLHYPVTIDPSTFTTSGNNFGSGNNEGGLDTGTSLTRRMSGASIGLWKNQFTATTNQTIGRTGQGTIINTAANGTTYIYVIGGCVNGCSGGSTLSTVQYAPINANGSLGEWKDTASMTKGRHMFTAVVNKVESTGKSYLYAVAGCNSGQCPTTLSDVEYVQFASDGRLTTPDNGCTPAANQTWCAENSPIATARFGQSSATHTFVANSVTHTFLYVMGGCSLTVGNFDCSTFRSDTQYIEFMSDGRLATPSGVGASCAGAGGTDWCTTTSFTNSRYSHASVTYSSGGNNYVAVMGGKSANNVCQSGTSSICNDFQFAQFQSDGSLGGWTTSTNTLTARWGHAAVSRNGYVYVFGGCDGQIFTGTCFTNSVQSVKINALGGNIDDVAGWTTQTGFYYGRIFPGVAINADIIYLLGGQTAANTCQGLTTQWCDDALYTKSAVADGALAWPGCSNGTPVWCGHIELPEGRQGFVSFTYTPPDSGVNGTTYIYIVGGETTGNACQNGTSNLCDDVIYAPILADSTIGSWQKLSSNFNIGRKQHGSLVYNGAIYVLGGESAPNSCQGGTSNLCNDVQYAALNPTDGTIGPWSSTTAFTTARRSFGSASFNGYMYVVGGFTTTGLRDVQYAKFNPDGKLSAWTSSVNLLPVGGRSSFPSIVYNGYLYAVGGCINACGSSDHRSDILKAALEDDGSNLNWVAACTNCYGGNITRTNPAATIHNGVMYVAGGHNTGLLGDVRVSSIGADGSLDRFTTETVMNAARYGLGLVANKNKLYSIGGCRTLTFPCTSPLSQVRIASIDVLGSTGSYSSAVSMPEPVYDQASVAYNGVIYTTGGCTDDNDTGLNGVYECLTSTNKVYYSTINVDGSLSAWSAGTDYTTLISNAVSRHAAVAHNGYLYILGGMRNNTLGGVYTNLVMYSRINSNGSLASSPFPTTSSLPANLGYMKAAVYNNYMYVFGGCTANSTFGDFIGQCTSTSQKVYKAGINANGTLGSWTEVGSNKMANTSTQAFALAVAGKYVYINGGNVNGTTTWVASFTESGGLGDFAVAGSNLPLGKIYHVSFAHNGNLYAAGGGYGAGFSEVYVAAINFSTGMIGAWTRVTDTFGLNHSSGLAYGGRTYFMGGFSSDEPQTSVQYATIYNGGTGHIKDFNGSGSWNPNTAMPNARSHHASVVLDEYLYVLGGETTANSCQSGTSSICNEVLKAKINSDGTLGSWVVDSTFANARRDLAAAVYEATDGNKYIYITGGCATTSINCTGSFLNDVQFAQVKSDGTGGLENWTSTTPFSIPERYSHTMAINKDFIYVFGGCSATDATDCTAAQSNVQKARLNSDGQIDVAGANTWTATTSLGLPGTAAPRYAHSTTIYNGKIYVIGGRQITACPRNDADTSSTSTACSQVYLGTFNPDGTITSWSVTGHLPAPLYSHASVAANGYLHVIGGATLGGVLENNTHYSSLHQDGSIGYWSKSLNLAAANNYLAGAYSNGYVYATGGTVNSTVVSYGGQQAPVRIGRYSILYRAPAIGNSLLDFCGGDNNEGFNFAGTIPSSSSLTLQYSLAGQANKWRGPMNTVSGILPNIGYDLSGSGRALFATLFIDDSKSATFPEDSSQQSSITAVNFNYRHSHAQPANRLRHGAFFTNEEQEVLDSNPIKPNPNTQNYCSSI